MYDAPDYKFLEAHVAKCRLWSEWDEIGKREMPNENPEFKPSNEEFEKYNREQDKLRVILAEVWAQAINSMPQMVSSEQVYIVHQGYRNIRCDSFQIFPDDYANVNHHEFAKIEREHAFDEWWDYLMNKDAFYDPEDENVPDTTDEEIEKYKEEYKKAFPYKDTFPWEE